ncbi:MAG: OmpA family protein [Candidatus Kapabacteria bacterium]|nr:OmpA family protein [Candidatus Kapabacteria bacterium]MDW8011661.1 OmpA family protein [Bacteroidota bacterium]
MGVRYGWLIVGSVAVTIAQVPQPIARVGISWGYGANLFSAQFRQLPGVPNCCPGFDGGRGTGMTVGLVGEYPWLPYAWLSGQLGFWTLSGELWERESIGNVALREENGDIVVRTAEVEHTLRASLRAVAADIGLSSRFFERFFVRLGVNVGVLIHRRYHQYEQLVMPEGAVFALEGSRRRNEFEGQIPEAPWALLGGSFAVGYWLPLGHGVEFAPTLSYTFFLTNLSSVSWKPSAFRLGISAAYSLYPPPEPLRDTIYHRDTSVVRVVGLAREEVVLRDRQSRTDTLSAGDRPLYRTTVAELWERRVPRHPMLTPTVQLALPDTATQLVVEELEQEEAFPLLPYIFFPEGSAELSQTRMQLLTPPEAQHFNERSLPMKTLQVYYHLLNIVGKRLQQFPQARLTITGCVSNVGVEENNRQLARKRAEAVRSYLTSVWGIAPERLQVQSRLLPAIPANPATPDGQEENRRVELSATVPEILAPVFLSEIGYVVNPSTILARMSVQAETTVARWQLRLLRAGTVLQSQEGKGMPPAELALSLVPEQLATGDTVISAELSVRDTLGTERVARITTSFRRLSLRHKRAERMGNERLERFAFMLFEYDKATLTKDHRRLLPVIRQRIMSGTRVVISGYADRTGDPAYNRRLADQRCRAVWQALGVRDVTPEIRAIGSDVLLYPNELPEGRAYSRTVLVELLTPIE